MKRNLKFLHRAVMAAAVVFGFCQAATAGTLTVLHSFTGTNGDGAYPAGGLTLSQGVLYGAASGGGGSAQAGTVFSFNSDGSGFTNLHVFAGMDGASPRGTLVGDGDRVFGTASGGGAAGVGTIFAVNGDGSGFTNVYQFGATGPRSPVTGLCLSGETLYGTTTGGTGEDASGSVFAVNTDGTNFTVLYAFGILLDMGFEESIGDPSGVLALQGQILYGTTEAAPIDYPFSVQVPPGSVFAVNASGLGLSYLHVFSGADGALPAAGVVLAGDTLYGTTSGGGYGNGTVFSISTAGGGVTQLHQFEGYDGSGPASMLVLSGNKLYGTTSAGGAPTSERSLPSTPTAPVSRRFIISAVRTGRAPEGALVLSGNALYGTTASGGSAGLGTIFALTLAPSYDLAGDFASGNSNGVWSYGWMGSVGGSFSLYTNKSSTAQGTNIIWWVSRIQIRR